MAVARAEGKGGKLAYSVLRPTHHSGARRRESGHIATKECSRKRKRNRDS